MPIPNFQPPYKSLHFLQSSTHWSAAAANR